MMEEGRKVGLIGGIGLLIIFTIIIVIGGRTSAFYWGIPIGIVFGIAACIYLSRVWDPDLLVSKNQEIKKESSKAVWVIPLGTYLVYILITSNTPEGSIWQHLPELVIGGSTSLIFITLSYFVIQLWRYRPK